MAWKGPKQGVGVKGKSGRKSKLEEVKNALAIHSEKVTQEALIELANNKVYQLLQTCGTIDEVKALGLPITLKGMTEKVEQSGNITINITKFNGDKPASPISA